MTLSTNVSNLATRVATEAKSLRTLLNGNAADNSALITTAKSNLVAAINEVAAAVAGASGIDDLSTSTTTTWSSSKITDYVGDEVLGLIDDVTPSLTSVYSSTKTDAQISAAVSAVIDSAPGALDTLNELAAALGDDANFASTVNAALANRVRFDAAQTLTAPQQLQARTNIGAVASADVGDTTTNYVTVFEAGLV